VPIRFADAGDKPSCAPWYAADLAVSIISRISGWTSFGRPSANVDTSGRSSASHSALARDSESTA
jgi:hypothetical protein